jgi:hypothetical protein
MYQPHIQSGLFQSIDKTNTRYDEVNEGTAMFKLAARRQDAPDQGHWLTLDADGESLPSDWYLRLAGEITRMFRGEIPPDSKLPAKPGPPWKGTARQ